jgi:hypothetical protein
VTQPFQPRTNHARAYLGGTIYYVSPPLSIVNGERTVELPPSVQERANRIIESEEVLTHFGARAVEQMWTIRPSRVQYLVDRTERDLEGSTVDWFDEEWFEKGCHISHEEDFQHIRLLSIVSALVRDCSVHNDAVIFFEEGGMVGLAPVGTRIGDIICRVDDLEIVGILREHEENLWMIAKAMQLSPLEEINKSSQEAVFDVDVGHLRVLARV